MFIASKHLPNPHDFRKDPAWRWHRSGYLLDHGRQPLRRDDTATREAWLFRRALGQCRGAEDREWLARDSPALIDAHHSFTSAVPLRRAELEARLLAGETDDVIARKCGMAPAGVTSYHDLYFDVRSKLQASGYIATVVLAGKPYKGIAPDDHEAILKSLGYAMGGEMVDEVLDCLRDPPVVSSLAGLDLDALRRLRDRLCTKVLILLETTPASAIHPETWIGLQQRFAEVRRAGRERGEDAAPMLNVVDSMGSGDIDRADVSRRRAEAADVRSVVEAVPA
jgi:hypothetical protein